MNDAFINPQTDNEIVGCYKNFIIVRREDGQLFYADIPPHLITIGEVYPEEDLLPITNLTDEQQTRIINKFGDKE